MMKERHTITFLIWLGLFTWPAILIWIPFLRGVCFLPMLYWINIPALWLGLAEAVGPPHFDIQEFGAIPQSLFAWMLIVAFWVLLSMAMTAITAYGFTLLTNWSKERE